MQKIYVINYCFLPQLHDRSLEITVWDHDRLEPNEFLGEVVIDMQDACLDNLAHWYPLNIHNYETPLPSPTPMTSPRGSFRGAQKDNGNTMTIFFICHFSHGLARAMPRKVRSICTFNIIGFDWVTYLRLLTD